LRGGFGGIRRCYIKLLLGKFREYLLKTAQELFVAAFGLMKALFYPFD